MKSIQLLWLFSLFGILACDSFLEVEPPKSQLVGVTVFEDKTTANAAMAHVYNLLRDSGLLTGSTSGASNMLGNYADEIIYYAAFDNNVALVFSNNLNSTTSVVSQKWRESYQQIYTANAIIEGCNQSTKLSVADKNQFIAEAMFVRALVHFYLVNLYGDVPYVTTTDYQVNRLLSRIPSNEVLNKIVEDLQNAIAMLPDQYISADRVRPNKATAQALLARTYLYLGNWAAASNMASAVITNPTYGWETDIQKVFLKGSPTTIWQFSPRQPGLNAQEGTTFIFQSGPPAFRGLSPSFYQSFAANDLRRTNWIRAISNSTSTWYHPFKYKRNNPTATSQEFSIVFRMAEMYLIRAEARARQGELVTAAEDLNKIRNLAGLPNTTANNSVALVDAILEERKFELFTEFGHRFFDLKRTGKLDLVLPQNKPGWDSNDQHWPIPETELLNNPNMTQNSGY